MGNSRAKGNRNRRKTIEALEKAGWEVAIIERTGRFIFPKDAFGLFDLLAVKYAEMPILVQVSTNKPHTHKAYKAFRAKHDPHVMHLRIEQWCWLDRKGVKKWQY
jgi:hypothetical protein